MQAVIILRTQGEILSQRNGLYGDVVQLGKHRVEAIGYIRKGHSPPVGGVGQKGKVQRLIRAVPHKDIGRLHAVLLRQSRLEDPGLRVGVEPQIGSLLGIEGGDHAGRGRIGGFIGVQLDILLVLGLLSGGIGDQPVQAAVEESRHGTPSSFVFYFISSLKR